MQYVNLLNVSHKKALAFVIRCEGEGYEPRQFKTWSPKVIAHIGALPPTVHDRSIEIRMRRKLPTEKVERLRYDHAPKSFTPLLRKAWAWAHGHEKQIVAAEPEVPQALDDRAQDNGSGASCSRSSQAVDLGSGQTVRRLTTRGRRW